MTKTSFIGYLLQNRKDNYRALALFIGFFVFYGIMNLPFVAYIKHNAAQLALHNPFYGKPFSLNLFNFDPSVYYGFGNPSVIHPLFNYLAGSLTFLADQVHGNVLLLVIQSMLNAIGVLIIFYYLRRGGADNKVAVLFTAFFGVSSYSMFTSMIPDSYPYAQFVILMSVLYLQYNKTQGYAKVWPNASLVLLNFGITATNIVPFAAALFFQTIDVKKRKTFLNFALVMAFFLLLAVVFTLLQFVLFDGKSWISNWTEGLQQGGHRYTEMFSFTRHADVIYMLVVNPILTPNLWLIDPGIVAFVTDLAKPYPFYVPIIASVLIVLAIAGFIRGIKTGEAWALAGYVGFAIYLHLYKGFGLALYTYDMYLYAGHYLFAFFLLGGRFMTQVRHRLIKNVLLVLISVFLLTTLGHNVMQHGETLRVVKESYADLKD